VSVRDPDFDPRGLRPRNLAHRVRPARSWQRWVGPALVVALVFAVGVLVLGSLTGGGGGQPSASPAVAAAAATSSPGSTGQDAASPGGSPLPGLSSGAAPGASATTAASPSASPGALVAADVPIVPVTGFRSTRTTVKPADVRAIASGSGAYDRLLLVADDADAILAALGIDRASLGSHLKTVPTANEVASRLATQPKTLAFLRAGQVGPSVRALGWQNRALFGVDRVRSLSDWLLTARLRAPAGTTEYDPATAWTLVAGGDILLDRGVSLAIGSHAAGVDFPFNGGTAEITGTCRNCSPLGWDTPYTRRAGAAGARPDQGRRHRDRQL